MRLVTWMVVVAGVGALAAGCGDSEDSETTPAATQATTQATQADTTTEETTADTEEASADSTERPDEDGDGTPDIQTFRAKVGDSITLVGQPTYKKASKEAVKVTVLGVEGPFSGFDVSGGNELIGIKVKFEGVGTKPFDDPQPNGQLTMSGGESGKQTNLISSGENPCDSPSLKLRKGQSATSCLAYEVAKNAKPQVFEYATSSGYGDTGIWRFR